MINPIEDVMKIADEIGVCEHGEIYKADNLITGERGSVTFCKADIRELVTEAVKLTMNKHGLKFGLLETKDDGQNGAEQ